jgi:hypothetical protein
MTISYPGVYVEEIRTSVKVIPGVAVPGAAASQVTPSGLLGAGYKLLETQIESSGLAMLFGKDNEHILVRMTDYREGSGIDGRMVVTFVGKVP